MPKFLMHDVALERMQVDMTFQGTHTCFGRIVEQLILPEERGANKEVDVIIIRTTSRMRYRGTCSNIYTTYPPYDASKTIDPYECVSLCVLLFVNELFCVGQALAIRKRKGE